MTTQQVSNQQLFSLGSRVAKYAWVRSSIFRRHDPGFAYGTVVGEIGGKYHVVWDREQSPPIAEGLPDGLYEADELVTTERADAMTKSGERADGPKWAWRNDDSY